MSRTSSKKGHWKHLFPRTGKLVVSCMIILEAILITFFFPVPPPVMNLFHRDKNPSNKHTLVKKCSKKCHRGVDFP